MSKIAVDVMSGDYAPDALVKGCIEALDKVESTIVLVGKKDKINEILGQCTYDASRIEIVDAEEVITMEDHPVNAIRTKKESSMVKGLKLVKEKEVEGFISAGNTGALLAGGTFIVGRIKGVDRPALAPLLPTKKGYSLLIDCGANMDAKPQYLQQFAKMGSIYMEQCVGKKNPSVGLINVGTEAEKGNQLTKETYQLLQQDPDVNFMGNIEARQIPDGEADVLVCDAFVGNVILKFMEGFGMWVFSMLKKEMTTSLKTKIGALLLKKSLYGIKGKFDYSDKGGAPLLGVNGLVVKTHGNSKEKQILYTIIQTEAFIKDNLVPKITAHFS